MNVNEQLAVITALEKWCKETKEEIRRQADRNLALMYEQNDVKKMALKVNGEEVGELIVTYHKEGFDVTDREAFEDFALTYGLAIVKRSIRPEMVGAAIKVIEGAIEPDHVRDFVTEEVVVVGDWENYMVNVGGKVLFCDSGMEVPGVAFRPRRPKGTQVRKCEPETVLPILQAMPGGLNVLLLGGGE